MSNSSIWPIDWVLSSATTQGQSEHVSHGKEVVLHIPQISKTGVLASDCLMLYQDIHWRWGLIYRQRYS